MKAFEAAGEAQLFVYDGQRQIAEAIAEGLRSAVSAIVKSVSRYADSIRLS